MKKRGIILTFALLLTILTPTFTLATDSHDVAYIYKSTKTIDKYIIREFKSHGFSVDLINERRLHKVNLNDYKIVFIGDDYYRKASHIKPGDYPTILANKENLHQFGLVDKDGASTMSSTDFLRVEHDHEVLQVYDMPKDIRRVSRNKRIQYHFLPYQNIITHTQEVASTHYGARYTNMGEVVSIIPAGSHLNYRLTTENICFFGITNAKYWTEEAKHLFWHCVDSVIESDEPSPLVHDVALTDFENSQNMIRLEFINGSDILTNELKCDEQYKVGIQVTNNGDFTESVEFVGNVGSVPINHESALDLLVGDSTIKTDTILLDLVPGDYTITVEALIDSEETPFDNIAERDITVLPCEQQTIHDVALVDFTNSVGGIRLEYPNGTDILGNQVMCNQDYKIGIKVENLGDFTEDITYAGSINGVSFQHNANTLIPGDDSTKTKTVNFALDEGIHIIDVEAIIDIDDNLANNFASRQIEVLCPQEPEPIPVVEILSPSPGQVFDTDTTTDVTVDFLVENWTVEGKGGTHIHFFLEPHPDFDSGDRLMFYNAPDNTIDFNFSPTTLATRIDDDTLVLNDLVPGTYTLHALLTRPTHAELPNIEASKAVTFTIQQTISVELIHDVSLIEFANSVNGINIEYPNGTDLLEGEPLICNHNYKVGIKVKNNGNFTENITYTGDAGGIDFSHLPTNNLEPGDDSTKTRTVNFTLDEGGYTIEVDALILNDAMQEDNTAEREFDVICPTEIASASAPQFTQEEVFDLLAQNPDLERGQSGVVVGTTISV